MGKKIFVCSQCGKEYESHKSNSKHCSRACRNAANSIEYNCDYCGAKIKVKKGIYQDLLDGKRKNIYCSKDCHNKGQVNSVEVSCKNCGHTFMTFLSTKDTNKFCSRGCYLDYSHNSRVIKICPSCGKTFFARHHNQKYCSTECRGNSMQIRVVCKCEQCGKEFRRKMSEITRSKKHFCTRDCKFEYIKNRDEKINGGLNQYMRGRLHRWRDNIVKDNGKCCITGKTEELVVHHCRSFNILMQETIDILNFSIKGKFDEYSYDDLKLFESTFTEIQEEYGEYVCVNADVHHLFHKEFGFGNNTIEQWDEFVTKYKAGFYGTVA